MITKAKVIQDLDYIKTKTPVKFKSFGIFFLKLLMLPVEDQEFIVNSLKRAAALAKDTDMINVITFSRPQIKLKESEQRFRFLIEHEFICNLCNHLTSKEVNMSVGHFAETCEVCYDKAQEYEHDSVANQLYD